MRKIMSMAILLACCCAIAAIAGSFADAQEVNFSNQNSPETRVSPAAKSGIVDAPIQAVLSSPQTGGNDTDPPEILDVRFSEGFENGGVIPAGWTDSPGNASWLYGDGTYWNPDWSPGAPHGGSYCAYFPLWDTFGDIIDSLISPSMDLSTGTGLFILRYWSWYPNSWGADSVLVYLKEGDALTRIHKVPVSDLNPTIMEWQQSIVPFYSSSINARIVYITYTGYGWSMGTPYIDDVKVSDAPMSGRCCYGDVHNPNCADNSLSECDALGGTWSALLTCAEDPCGPTPVNDQCFEAQAIVGPYPQTVSGTVINATADCPGFLDDGWNGVWYTIALPYASNNVVIDFSPSCALGLGIDRIGNAWMPDCSCTAREGFQSLEWGYCDTVNYNPQYPVLSGTIAGPTTIYFPCYVGQTPRDFAFTVKVEESVPVIPDFQITAARGIWTGGNTRGAHSDCMSHASEDQVWEITIPYSDSVWIFSLCGSDPGWNSYLALGSSICSDDISSNDDDCDGLSSITAGLDSGTYYLTVEGGRPSDCGAYQLSIDIAPPPPPNDNCADVTPVDLGAGDTLTFNGDNTNSNNDCDFLDHSQVWEAFTTTEPLDITIDYCGTSGYSTSRIYGFIISECPCSERIWRNAYDYTTCPDEMTTNYFISLQPGTYYIPVRMHEEEAVGPYTIHVTGTAVPPPPANDECANAQATGDVVGLPYITTRAYFDGSGECISSPNVWYLYTAPTTAIAKISLCGSAYDTKLAVYDGSDCSTSPILGCNDDSCEIGSIVLIDAVEGNQYLIEVGGSGPSHGEGLLSIEMLSAGCSYVLGDVNGNDTFNGIDVIYAVNYLKGGPPPPQICECGDHGAFYAVGDVNGSCSFNGIDVTYTVNYFKGGPLPHPCDDCPPASLTSSPGPAIHH